MEKVPENERDTPWRRVNLKDLVIPEGAKEAAKKMTPAIQHVSVGVKNEKQIISFQFGTSLKLSFSAH